MKLKLPQFLYTALLAAICSTSSLATDTLKNLTPNGDGSYRADVTIDDSVNATWAGGAYVDYSVDGSFNPTGIRDVSITMTGGNVTETLAAGSYRACPINGTSTIEVTGGTIGKLIGANHIDAALDQKYGYGSATYIDSVSLTVGGTANIKEIRGGNLVGADAPPDAAFLQNYGQIGNISITIKDEATVGTIHGAAGCDTVNGKLSCNVEGGTINMLLANNGASVAEDVSVNVENGNITGYVIGTAAGNTKGNTNVTMSSGYAYMLLGAMGGTVEGDTNLTIKGGTAFFADGVYGGHVKGNANVTVEDGTNTYVYAVSGGTVEKDANLTIKDGSNTVAYCVNGGTVKGDANVTISGGNMDTIAGGNMGRVEGNVYISMKGGTTANLFAANAGTVGKNTVVRLLGGTVTGYVYGGDANLIDGTRTLYVGTETQAYNGSVGHVYGFDKIIIAPDSSLTTTYTNSNFFDVKEHTYTLTNRNLTNAIASAGGQVFLWDADTITLNIEAGEKLKSGRYRLIDATKATLLTNNWKAEKVIVNAKGIDCSFEQLKWEDNMLVFYYRGEEVDSALASNWGLFKSSHAFVSSLSNRYNNATPLTPTSDGKAGLETKGRTYAWGSAYGQSARIGGIGADYTIFGASIGAEHHFIGGRTLGAAIGYDWGTISPFGGTDIDQESAHMALYGRAATWSIRNKGSLVIDWSAALSDSTAETSGIEGDWNQKNMQLDARLTYWHQLNTKLSASVFTGIQYYTAENAKAAHIDISSMQNLRTEIGSGINYKATQKTTLRAEISMYNDTMRHNPCINVDETTYHGTNPGRLGGSISAGAAYRLNDKWNLYGNYSFEAADDSIEHNVNVGASCAF